MAAETVEMVAEERESKSEKKKRGVTAHDSCQDQTFLIHSPNSADSSSTRYDHFLSCHREIDS